MNGAALIILDGWGLAPAGPGNAISLAHTPTIDRLRRDCPATTLLTSGRDVGLPEGQMGNSEVGHLTLGAGRVVAQDLVRISDAIEDGSFFECAPLVEAIAAARRVHILGLASDGGVHSHLRHLEAVAEVARRAGKPFFFHAFTDGRDVSPTSGAAHIGRLEAVGPVATVCGRYWAMDRDRRWDRTKRAYDALVLGNAEKVKSAAAAVKASYVAGTTDEFLEPVTTGAATVEDGDVVVFANFRADRARQLTEALTAPEFSEFERERVPQIAFLQMTRYREDFDFPALYPRAIPAHVFGVVCAGAGVANLRVAETEKYAHVTYFFNGGAEAPCDGEERIMVASPKVATYDLQPEMSAAEVGRRGAEGVRSGRFSALILNFANPDMVGHTGIVVAATRACEAVDTALADLLAAIEECGWSALVTADHGNAECLIDPATGGPHTAHTTNPVPCWLVGKSVGGADGRALREGGTLRDVSPTLLDLLGVSQPPEMTGASLLR